MAKDKKHPLTFFREQYEKRAKNLKKYQGDVDTGETGNPSPPPPPPSMMNPVPTDTQNLKLGYNKQLNPSTSFNVNAKADLNTKGQTIANPIIDASVTKGGFSGGVTYDPTAPNKFGAKVTYKKGPFDISVGTRKKGGSTKSKKKK